MDSNPKAVEIEGWFSDADASFVTGIVSDIHHGLVVEIGVFKGLSTAHMAPICVRNGTRYIAIDNFKGSRDEKDPATVAQHAASTRPIFERNMETLGLLRHIAVWESDSVAASERVDDGSVDFVFIDGDHTGPGIMGDIGAWWPKVKPGGIMAGHDYEQESAVVCVVDEFRHGKEFWTHGSRCWAVRKP